MIKEAGDNVGKFSCIYISDGSFIYIANATLDTCHASEFQLREVQSGYRHSTDPAR